ncbi:MAG: tRNA 2-thiouridine(34) synthase MnmA [Spirochaetota bacterium]
MSRILVAMSGGVDSSVAAYLLKKQGHDIAGITMALGIRNPDGTTEQIGESAAADAKKVCEVLGIDHYTEDLTALFNEKVIQYFIREYEKGRTPNPCMMCNRYLKFGALISRMRELGYDSIATGHYARISSWEGRPVIIRNDDERKDQTYFLWGIERSALESIIFPLSELKKTDIRAIAADAGLPVAHKAESQDICFIAEDYRRFIEAHAGIPRPGYFVSRNGGIYGTHRGIPFYTIGQRRGLGISAPAPLYVTAFNADKNEVVLGYKEDLAGIELEASSLNFHTDILPLPLTAKIRYAHPAAPCEVSIDGGIMTVRFHEPVDSITAGQAVVLYHGTMVVGGGIIDRKIR